MSYDYFYGNETEQYSFIRIPKVFFTNEKLNKLSAESKILYAILLDRSSLSYKNGWVDEEDRVYIIFTIDEIQETLNCSNKKAVKLLKELDTDSGIGLVEKKRIGLNKPNRMYIRNFMRYML